MHTAAAILIVSFLVPVRVLAQEPDKLSTDGMEQLRAARASRTDEGYRIAEETFSRVLASSPNHAHALVYRGEARIMRGVLALRTSFGSASTSFDSGISDMDRAVSLAPTDLSVRVARGVAYAEFPDFYNKKAIARQDLETAMAHPDYGSLPKALRSRVEHALKRASDSAKDRRHLGACSASRTAPRFGDCRQHRQHRHRYHLRASHAMITSLIVDDEKPARAHLRRLLSAHSDVDVIGEASNGLEALERASEVSPDLMFLEIEMPGLNGFQVISELRRPPITVFTTAFDKYAIRAFDANALDYVLKPVQLGRLAQALTKVRAMMSGNYEAYRADLRKTASSLAAPTKLAGRRGNRLMLLSPKEVLYVAIGTQLTFLYTSADRFLTDRTITELEHLLAPVDFLRISRSAIVNLQYARELLPWTSGTYRIKLSNGTELDVSRERARTLKEHLS
jgi:DNA-binding LytR/AlgR family response regulator